MKTIVLRVRVLGPDAPEPFTFPAEWSETVASLITRIHLQFYLAGQPAQWRFFKNGEQLSLDAEVGPLIGADPASVELELMQVESSGVSPFPLGLPARKPSAPPSGRWKVPAPESAPAPRSGGGSRFHLPSISPLEAPASADDEDYLAGGVRTQVERRATVRYYDRMNPQRTFPLLVILSAEQIATVKKRAVKHAESQGFSVVAGSRVEVEPVLPGCDCYPPKDAITITDELATATFWVVPHVLGPVQGARVVVRQNGVVLAEVPLQARVRRQTLSVVFGLLGLFSPYLMMGLKVAKLDVESQQSEGFPIYRQAGEWLVSHVQPGFVGVAMLVAAGVSYWWARPRSKDVFWEVKPA